MVRGTTPADTLARARAAGVGVASFPDIATAAPDSPGIAFGYGMIDAVRIDQGLALLHRCLVAGQEPRSTST
jgi:GntR family transcriptional regulator/MocR family aminotransferase